MGVLWEWGPTIVFVDWKKQASHDGWKFGNLGIRDDSKDWPRKMDTTRIHGGGFNPFKNMNQISPNISGT